MLLKSEILKYIEDNKIVMYPYTELAVNTNSIDLHLAPELYSYNNSFPLDFKINSDKYDKIILSSEGYLLRPNYLYLAATAEYTETFECVPYIRAKSSCSRNGLDVVCSGGLGDIGYKGHWTLALTVTVPIVIYPYQPICQIVYEECVGDTNFKYSNKNVGRYNNDKAKPVPYKYKDKPYWDNPEFLEKFNVK